MKGEIFLEALNSIKGNVLRSSITVSIIAIGILSLVGALSATTALNNTIKKSFGKMGAESFIIKGVSYRDLLPFAEQYENEAEVVPYVSVDLGLSVASAEGRFATPDVDVIGVAGDFVGFNGGDIAYGRGFSYNELAGGRGVCILGANVVKLLFTEASEGVIGQQVDVKGCRFNVVGVLDDMGGGPSLDNVILVPMESARFGLLTGDETYSIGILPRGAIDSDEAASYAAAVMQRIKGAKRGGDDDFEVRKRESTLSQMKEMMGMVTAAAFIVGMITMLGAAVALMNIMLVSVKERTQEIGVRKAIGATPGKIKDLFLAESLMIGVIGGIAGVVLGLIAGWGVATAMETDFVVPWVWIGVSLMVCMAVSLLSGGIPARRAAALPPIEALRGE